jgi:hypothetical protein
MQQTMLKGLTRQELDELAARDVYQIPTEDQDVDAR